MQINHRYRKRYRYSILSVSNQDFFTVNQVKRNQTSERKHTQKSSFFHLFFLCLCGSLFSSCDHVPKYDFQSPDNAIHTYRTYHKSVADIQKADAEKIAVLITDWQSLSDTVLHFLDRNEAESQLTIFSQLRDSIRFDLFRLTDSCTLHDLAIVKLHVSSSRTDHDLDSLRQEAVTYFSSLDRTAIPSVRNADELLEGYRLFLLDARKKKMLGRKELLEFIAREDLYFRTFLTHIGECTEKDMTEITRLTEENCRAFYQAVANGTLLSEEVLVFMSMRTVRRLLMNAQECHDLLRKGKINSSGQAVAYLWMMLQPFISIDDFALTMLTDKQQRQWLDLADDYPKIISRPKVTQYYNIDYLSGIPNQLMRLYLSTL